MHRYILEPYNGRASRYACPGCGHRRHTFKRYIDTESGNALADHVGKCDRADGCGYHYPPREYFAGNPVAGLRQAQTDTRQAQTDIRQVKPFDTLPRHYVDDTARAYHHNNFTCFLVQYFGEHITRQLAAKYKIGTSRHWPGSTIFWQIDINDRVRTGKIMLYNITDGHRVKQPFNHITWAHITVGSSQLAVVSSECGVTANSKLTTQNFNLRQCFFGEHLLLTNPFKTVAIAESEKTAVIACFFYPKYIWLASGSLEGLSWDKCKVLKDRRVILFPDVNGYDKWRQKAREMNLRLPGANFTVDDTLELTASDEERSRGIDIADRWIEQMNK